MLACVPPTGHHTVGLVTACQSGYYVKHPRGNPACCASLCPRFPEPPSHPANPGNTKQTVTTSTRPQACCAYAVSPDC